MTEIFTPVGDNTSGSATTSSGTTRVALGAFQPGGRVARVVNVGAVAVFIKFGPSDVEATSASTALAAGQTAFIDAGNATHFAVLAASSTATVYVQPVACR